MKLYPIEKAFRDLEDDSRLNEADGWYPRRGLVPSEERIQALLVGGYIGEVGEAVKYPLETGGGWYELSNGERVQGKKEAEKKQAKLTNEKK